MMTTRRPLATATAVVLSALWLTGCATSGMFNSGNLTNVELSERNYEVVATNVTGEAEAGYILGFSGAARGEMHTFALIRVEGDGFLYQEALANLWTSFEADFGPSEGRSLALANVRYDFDALNVLGLYTKPKVSIRADIIEFVD